MYRNENFEAEELNLISITVHDNQDTRSSVFRAELLHSATGINILNRHVAAIFVLSKDLCLSANCQDRPAIKVILHKPGCAFQL